LRPRKEDFGTVQRPYEEFLLLCYLKIENGTFSSEDFELTKEIIMEGGVDASGFKAEASSSHSESLVEFLGKKVSDADVRKISVERFCKG
jgi:hypothetical protein